MKHLQVLLLAFLRFFPRGTYGLLQGYCVLVERKQPDFSGSVRFYSELMLIPGDPKKRCCPPVKVRASGGQVVSRVLAEVQLTVGSVGPKLLLWLWCQTQNA